MIICICRRVSDRDIASAVHQGDCRRFEDLQQRLGVATGCGACRDCARQTFEAMSAPAGDGGPTAGFVAPAAHARPRVAAASTLPDASVASLVPATSVGTLLRSDAPASAERRSSGLPVGV